jgi:hypothetical protein
MKTQLFDYKTKNIYREFFINREYKYMMTLRRYNKTNTHLLNSIFKSIENIFDSNEEEVIMFPELDSDKNSYHMHFLIYSDKNKNTIRYKLTKIDRFNVDLQDIKSKSDVVDYFTKHFCDEYQAKYRVGKLSTKSIIVHKTAEEYKAEYNLVNIHEAVNIIGSSPVTIHRLAKRSMIGKVIYLKKAYFNRDDLYRYVNNNLTS